MSEIKKDHKPTVLEMSDIKLDPKSLNKNNNIYYLLHQNKCT